MKGNKRSPKPKWKPAPSIKINGVEHATVYTEDGDGNPVQRFPANRTVSALYDASAHHVGMNRLWIDQQEGRYTLDEMRELYRLIGYSICGYAEIFEDDEIENPVWEKAHG